MLPGRSIGSRGGRPNLFRNPSLFGFLCVYPNACVCLAMIHTPIKLCE